MKLILSVDQDISQVNKLFVIYQNNLVAPQKDL